MISATRKIQVNEKFGKSYKLCKEKEISLLFKGGVKTHKFPFSVHYMLIEEDRITPFQMVISVPKRNFKKAHDRNRIKRQIKEAIRKNKLNLETFLINEKLQLSVFILYSHKEELKFDDLSKKTEHFISFLIENIKNEKLSN
jgi:ribonuclease P protein component|tara:strand:- start:448 stop:873 length:426 start_codon:yes stop_codon:yes gene_type:complete